MFDSTFLIYLITVEFCKVRRFLKQIIQRPVNTNRKADQRSEKSELSSSANRYCPMEYLRDRLEMFKLNYQAEVQKTFLYSAGM